MMEGKYAGTPPHNVQAVCYKELLKHAFPPNIDSTIYTRVRKIFDAYTIEDNALELDQAKTLLRSCRQHDSMRVLKTWTNSWATTHRFHKSGRLPCLMGYPDEPDSLDYYAFCARIQSIIILSVAGFPPSPPVPTVPSSLELGTVGCRWNGPIYLGLDDPCRLNLQCMHVLCVPYSQVHS